MTQRSGNRVCATIECFPDESRLVVRWRDEDVFHAAAKGFRFVKALQGDKSYNGEEQ